MGGLRGSTGAHSQVDLGLNLMAAYLLPSGLNSAQREMAFDSSGTCITSPAGKPGKGGEALRDMNYDIVSAGARQGRGYNTG